MSICNRCKAHHNNRFSNGKHKKNCGMNCKKNQYAERQLVLEEHCRNHIEWLWYYKLLPYEMLCIY